MTTLKAALKEVCYLELEDIPSEEVLSADDTLTFSAPFERKMKKLIRRADHPIRYRVTQAVACLLLVALLSGCTVLAISPEARGAFVGWVREVFERWYVYRYTGETQDTPSDVVYCPTWVPDGYFESSVFDLSSQTVFIYENGSKEELVFGYAESIETVALYVDLENATPLCVEVNGIQADLYTDISGEVKHLIWTEKGKLFFISAHCSDEQLIKMAESVEVQAVPKELAVYRPAWLPEGFVQSEVPELSGQVVVVYMDDEGRMTAFGYSDDTLLHVQVDNPEISKVNVNGTPADFYFDPDDTHANILVWVNPENNYIFWISAPLTREELIRMAESVEVVQ